MSPVLMCDLSEARNYLKIWPMSNSICILPQNIEELEQRGKIEDKKQLLQDLSWADKNEDARIGYKVLNKDLEKTNLIFISMINGLYIEELKSGTEWT